MLYTWVHNGSPFATLFTLTWPCRILFILNSSHPPNLPKLIMYLHHFSNCRIRPLQVLLVSLFYIYRRKPRLVRRQGTCPRPQSRWTTLQELKSYLLAALSPPVSGESQSPASCCGHSQHRAQFLSLPGTELTGMGQGRGGGTSRKPPFQ